MHVTVELDAVLCSLGILFFMLSLCREDRHGAGQRSHGNMLRVMGREELPHMANMFMIGRLQLISPGKRNLLVRLFVGRCLSWIEGQDLAEIGSGHPNLFTL
jgi:hypothetical protein